MSTRCSSACLALPSRVSPPPAAGGPRVPPVEPLLAAGERILDAQRSLGHEEDLPRVVGEQCRLELAEAQRQIAGDRRGAAARNIEPKGITADVQPAAGDFGRALPVAGAE